MADRKRSAPGRSRRICQPLSEAGKYVYHFAHAIFILAIMLALRRLRGEQARALRGEA